ncbi:acyl-protein synthase [Burkholderia pyrrocinia]|uniref:LuxE/PaaK family acyltransferase n=1 Tax=Burkholderia pyrrocinia TaxID=60550 RepID=UPI00104D7FCB|nr:acyl-protein synthase [Burkholderia pyrrocinia]TDA47801.1 acyl-protein synthase [Burkholderia pyrrocinia]
MTLLPAVTAFCAIKSPYRLTRRISSMFDRAMRELIAFHYAHTPGYARWLSANDFTFERARALNDWSQLPPIFARYFKQALIPSHTAHDAIELTSPDTPGRMSPMLFDTRSISAVQSMVGQVFCHYGWSTQHGRHNYILLTYEPHDQLKLWPAYVGQLLCSFAPVRQIAYALRRQGEGHTFDVFGVVRALQEFACDGHPVRIIGYPALLWLILEHMRTSGCPPLNLHADSLVFLGGDWKAHAAIDVPKPTLYRCIREQLGIAADRCRNAYGTLQHPIPYVECDQHHSHVPVYSRVYIRDPSTLSRVSYGERGLLHAVSPYITSSPAHSIVMGDLATLYPGHSCSCGLETDWFELHEHALACTSHL